MDLSGRFVESVRGRGAIGVGPVLVACSGGSDSTALARLVAAHAEELGLASFALAHLDHGLREGAARDARFVEALALELGVPAFIELRHVDAEPDESPEAAARRVRYRFLADVASREGYPVVATGHTCDDQAETVLFRALTGTGLRGLQAIRPDRPLEDGGETVLVRPLLPFRRSELRDWLTAGGHDWCEDPTNADGNVRAKLRNLALPLLEECVGRDVVPLLARLADTASTAMRTPIETVEVAARWVLEEADRFVLAPGAERFSFDELHRSLTDALQRLRRDRAPPSRAELERLWALARGEAQESVAGVEVRREGERVVVSRAGADAEIVPDPVPLSVPGEVWMSGVTVKAWLAPANTSLFLQRLRAREGGFELLDHDRIVPPLTVGPPREGDVFTPLGAVDELRLSGFLQRRGVAAADRRTAPIVYDAQGVLWVVGHRIAARAALGPTSQRVLALEARTDYPA